MHAYCDDEHSEGSDGSEEWKRIEELSEGRKTSSRRPELRKERKIERVSTCVRVKYR